MGRTLFLFALVFTPLLIKNYRSAGVWIGKRGTAWLDQLDRNGTPFAVRVVLRWLISPLSWYAAQVGSRERATDAFIGTVEPLDAVEAIEPEDLDEEVRRDG